MNDLRSKVAEMLSGVLSDKEITKYTIISKILEDDYCFFKMPVNDAFSILFDLGYNKKEAENIYKRMLSITNYVEIKDDNL